MTRPLPEEALLPRGVAEALLVHLFEGCGYLHVSKHSDGNAWYSYDGAMSLRPEYAGMIDRLMELAEPT